ncbi:MAG: L-threonylcarbamoyladenylate synthase [Burkholderiales bacterium]
MVTDEEIERAAAILRTGRLVAFPTETVYGLGADATNAAAVRRIFAVKGRPAGHPLIVHISDMSGLKHWAADVPRGAWLLAEKYWPGPLTMILKRAPHVSDAVTGGQHTIGLRVPAHPVAQRLLKAFGGGVAAPSANRFGRLSPTTAEHVHEDLGNAADAILDGGPCPVGIESTIVDLSGTQPAVLRPGHIGAKQIEDALLVRLGAAGAASPRTPGRLASHYAPLTALKLVHPNEIENFIRRQAPGAAVAVLARRSRPRDTRAALWQVAPELPEEYARHLYALLRRIDSAGCALILVESPPELPEWTAVRDRLSRAATAEQASQSSAVAAR